MRSVSWLSSIRTRISPRRNSRSRGQIQVLTIVCCALTMATASEAYATLINYQITNGSVAHFADGNTEIFSGNFIVDTTVPQATFADITVTGNPNEAGIYSFVEVFTNFNGAALVQLWVAPPSGFGPDMRLEFSGSDPANLQVTRAVFSNAQKGFRSVDLHPQIGLIISEIRQIPEPDTRADLAVALGFCLLVRRAVHRPRQGKPNFRQSFFPF